MTADISSHPATAARPGRAAGHIAGAAGAMFLVGTLAAVSGVIARYPLYGGQAVRYAVAAAILFGAARARGLGPVRLARRRGPGERDGVVRLGLRELGLLAALSLTGLVIFNVCVVEAARASGPSLAGIVLGTVPLALAVLGPLTKGLSGRASSLPPGGSGGGTAAPAAGGRAAPSPRLVTAALVVVAGATLATGLGSGSLPGLLWSLGALLCELCFSLLALPLLPALGPIRLSACSAALAVPFLLVIGLVEDGTGLLRMPTLAEALGLAYLTVVVTTVAFFLWYRSLPHLGADRAGLFAGMIPVGAIVTTAVLGLGAPSAGDIAGAALVVTGVLLGLLRG